MMREGWRNEMNWCIIIIIQLSGYTFFLFSRKKNPMTTQQKETIYYSSSHIGRILNIWVQRREGKKKKGEDAFLGESHTCHTDWLVITDNACPVL